MKFCSYQINSRVKDIYIYIYWKSLANCLDEKTIWNFFFFKKKEMMDKLHLSHFLVRLILKEPNDWIPVNFVKVNLIS
jgi:hypothetical protein